MSEFPDRNKTDLTHNITAVAAAYLASRGFKPIETEVCVADGWIADLASFVYPTQTELKNLRLYGGRKIIQEQYDSEDLFFRHYGAPFTAIVEVKTTRQDYLKDEKRKFDGRIFPAHLCYLAYPIGLIEQPPEGWIGLIVDEKRESLLKIKVGGGSLWYRIHPQHAGDITDLIAAVAVRCYHRTKYAAMRAWSKAYRAGKDEEALE